MVKVRYWGAALLLVVLASLSLPGITYASMLCRSDPSVTLSNGMKLTIGADIAAAQTQVQYVEYDLHVPVGVSMSNKLNTPGWSNTQEIFTIKSDQPANQYRVYTTVHTTISHVAVTSYSSYNGNNKAAYTAVGFSGQLLSIGFSH